MIYNYILFYLKSTLSLNKSLSILLSSFLLLSSLRKSSISLLLNFIWVSLSIKDCEINKSLFSFLLSVYNPY
jgi:hypothetical protein